MRKGMAGMILAGSAAGIVAGTFGAGGGLVLVPLLEACTDLEEDRIFPCSIAVILPVCLVSLAAAARSGPLPWESAAPFLAGGIVGGLLAGIIGNYFSVLWLHRMLGILIVWGGIRNLWTAFSG